MLDPTQPDAPAAAAAALDAGSRGVCLFPAMHRFGITDDRVKQIFEVAVARPGTVMFVHCGVLTIGVRRKLGLPSPFEIRFGNRWISTRWPPRIQLCRSSFPISGQGSSARR
jgi:hypothetical protein